MSEMVSPSDIGTAKKVVSQKKKKESPAAKKPEPAPKTPKTPKTPKVPAKPKEKKGEASLEDVLQANYPQYAYLLKNPDVFGQDVVDAFRTADRDDWEPERLAAAIRQTTYWQTTVALAKNFDAATEADRQALVDDVFSQIKGITGVESIETSAVNTFARDMARRGVKGENLKTMTYQFIFREGNATRAAQEALFSQDAADMKSMAKMYGSSLTDDDVRNYLGQGKKPADLQRMYREKLKAQYPHLAGQLDADLTFQDIVGDYQRLAAQVLEKTPESIDFMKPEYMEAIASRDANGNTRQLSLGEWQTKLKTDDRYGYSKTKTAIRDARVLASNIARSFGKVI